MMQEEKTAILYSFQIHAIINLDCVRLFHRLAVTADCLIAVNSGHHSYSLLPKATLGARLVPASCVRSQPNHQHAASDRHE